MTHLSGGVGETFFFPTCAWSWWLFSQVTASWGIYFPTTVDWKSVLGSARISPEASRGQSWAGWPKLAKQNRIFHTMCHYARLRWGSWPGGRQSWFGSARGTGRWELLCAFCSLFCVFSLSVLLLLLLPSFAVLLNCPYPNPPVFFPFSFHSLPHPSGGRGDRATMWPFVTNNGQSRTVSQNLLSMVYCGILPSCISVAVTFAATRKLLLLIFWNTVEKHAFSIVHWGTSVDNPSYIPQKKMCFFAVGLSR